MKAYDGGIPEHSWCEKGEAEFVKERLSNNFWKCQSGVLHGSCQVPATWGKIISVLFYLVREDGDFL